MTGESRAAPSGWAIRRRFLRLGEPGAPAEVWRPRQVHGAEGCYGSDSSCSERPASPGAVNPQSANRYCSACP